MSTWHWFLREAAWWPKNVWHWPESGTVPPPDVCFCRGNSSHILVWLKLDASLHEWSQPSVLGSVTSVSAFVWLLELLQETKLTVLTKSDEKGYLCETYFCKQCLSLIGGIKEFEIMVAEFVSAVSSSTHFSVSDRCRWKRYAKNNIAYSFKYNNNKNTFLSPYKL